MSPMKKEVTLAMSQKQINRYHVIMNSLEGKVTVAQAATSMGISERQVIRLRNGVKKEGAAFLIHGNTNRSPSHAVKDDTKARIVSLYCEEKYHGANFLHFSELLAEHEGIQLSESAIGKILKATGIESPKKRRRFKPHRRRKRKKQEGLLVQMDATPYEWFGGDKQFALHGGIDDATGHITGLYMTENECLQGYFETVRQTIVNGGGVPVGIYADRHTIFRSPVADKLTIEDQLAGKRANDTQFGRAIKELGINLIAARSPQARGRIERLWQTLQSRLVIELRVHNINTVHDANAFFVNYIPKFNEQFGVEPEDVEKAYVPTLLDLSLILCVKETRIVDNGGVFSFYGRSWKVICGDIPGKTKIEVIASASRGMIVLHKGKILEILPYIKPQKTKLPPKERKKIIPSDDHCWRREKPAIPLYSSDLVYSEVYEMLNDIFLAKYA